MFFSKKLVTQEGFFGGGKMTKGFSKYSEKCFNSF